MSTSNAQHSTTAAAVAIFSSIWTMRVLIADDHTLYPDGLRSLLETRGVEVIGEAHNGREAVAQAKRPSPDIVLMDLHMPELDGLAATRLIKVVAFAVRHGVNEPHK
jgi:DNA-binding NarL/FixJ family response regulator